MVDKGQPNHESKSTRYFCKEVYILHTYTFCFQLAKLFWIKTCNKHICRICSIFLYYCFKPLFVFPFNFPLYDASKNLIESLSSQYNKKTNTWNKEIWQHVIYLNHYHSTPKEQKERKEWVCPNLLIDTRDRHSSFCACGSKTITSFFFLFVVQFINASIP